jgi:hypothetical protein
MIEITSTKMTLDLISEKNKNKRYKIAN